MIYVLLHCVLFVAIVVATIHVVVVVVVAYA